MKKTKENIAKLDMGILKRYAPHILVIILAIIFIVRKLTYFVKAPDSYYFINHIIYNTEVNTPFLSKGILYITKLLSNYMSIQSAIFSINFIFFIFTIAIIYYLGIILFNKDKRMAIIYILLTIANSYVFSVFFRFEDDFWAYPFYFSIILFIIIESRSKIVRFFNIFMVSLISLVSSYIWFPILIIYYIIMGIILVGTWGIVLVYIIGFILNIFGVNLGILAYIYPNLHVLENLPLIFINSIFIYIPGIIYFIKNKLYKSKQILASLTIITFIIGLFNAKLGLFFIPFGAYYTIKYFQKREEMINIFSIIYILNIFIVLFGFFTIPYNYHLQTTILYANNLASDNHMNFKNEWSLGYYIDYVLGPDKDRYKGHTPEIEDYHNSIVLTTNRYSYIMNDYNCPNIYKDKFYSIWRCN